MWLHSKELGDDFLKKIANIYTGAIKISHCPKITKAGIQELLNAEGISKATIIGCYNVTGTLNSNGKEVFIRY